MNDFVRIEDARRAGERVCVHVASYQQRPWLTEAVESVLAQSYRDFHVYIVDDASTDGSPELIRELVSRNPRRLDAAFHESNRGIPARLQTGLEHCDSEYFIYLDGDDLWERTALESLVAVLDSQPEVGLAHANAAWFEDTSGRVLRLRHATPPPQGDVFEQLLTSNLVSAVAALLRRRHLREAGLSLRDCPIRLSCDYYLWLTLAARAKLAYVDRVLGRHRVHGGNAGRDAPWDAQRADCLAYLVERQPDLINRVVRGLLSEVERLRSAQESPPRSGRTRPLLATLRGVLRQRRASRQASVSG